ncbi:MAG: phosphopentomutase [Ruminococcaceae bacterium]|nr:phosphopentomutase [Oscillospiraceae bacterium]
MNKRVFLIVLDSFGIGEMPDSYRYGDKGANTLKSISKSEFFACDNMRKLGLFNIDGVDLPNISAPLAVFARLGEVSEGKDTTIGHWEIAGIVSEKPLPTYPCGFPDHLIEEFSRLTARGVLCNRPYSGTEVIKDYGKEHLESGDLIVYTSADSVFQIAAHEKIVPVEELYEYCRIARSILVGEHGVGRIIARPFIGVPGDFTRTSNRHDFSLEPPEATALDLISGSGYDVISVGKINDIFVGRGITEHVYTTGNTDGMKKTLEYVKKDFNGLCFVNLVDFDMLYGHRNDIDGYAKAISEFDMWLGEFVPLLKDDDLLIITADHGCDPGYIAATDHTREYVPFLMFGKNIKSKNLGTKQGFFHVGATVCAYLSVNADICRYSLF